MDNNTEKLNPDKIPLPYMWCVLYPSEGFLEIRIYVANSLKSSRGSSPHPLLSCISLCSPGYIYPVDQTGIKFRDPSASASPVLGLKVCAETGLEF